MSAITKEDLHRLVDDLPDSELPVARRILEALRISAPVEPIYSFENAPLDDEPTTPEEDASAAEAWDEYQRGEALSADEAKRLLLS